MNQQYSEYHFPMHAYPGIIYQQPIPQQQQLQQGVPSSSQHIFQHQPLQQQQPHQHVPQHQQQQQYMAYNGNPSTHYSTPPPHATMSMQAITPQLLQGNSNGNGNGAGPSNPGPMHAFQQNTFFPPPPGPAPLQQNGYTDMNHYGVTGPMVKMEPRDIEPHIDHHSHSHSQSGSFGDAFGGSSNGVSGADSIDNKDMVGANGGVGKWKSDKDKEGPVKNACLSCRTKKAKCDGQQPVCGQCEKKNLECVFVKSRRGGARKKRDVAAPSALQEFLKKLDTLMTVHDAAPSPAVSEPNDDPTDIVRTFASRHEILKCYYEEVHPFLPVMPPKRHLEEILPTLAEDSPFLLATQTILVLAPHPKDENPKSSNSKRLRQVASNDLSKRTMELVTRTLADRSTIECVQALAMLSMWEWASAGSLSGNRARAGQAVQVAMEMGLHELDKHKAYTGVALEGEDWKKDMARRTWWTVYVAQLTASMVGGTVAVVGADDPRIRVDFPVCSLQDRAWPNWVNANRYCVRIFGLINQAFYGQGASMGWGSPGSADSATDRPSSEEIRQKVYETDQQVMELMKQAEASAVIDLVPGGEEEVVRNQQLSTRLGLSVTHIHIHRQQAFPEVSLFSKRICGLPQAPDYTAQFETDGLPNGAGTGTIEPAAFNGGDGSFSLTDGYDNYKPNGNAAAAANGASSVSLQQQSSSESQPRGSDIMLFNTDSGSSLSSHSHSHSISINGLHPEYDFMDELWQPETFPEALPAPWFAYSGGAAALYAPIQAEPQHLPPLTATITAATPSDLGAAVAARRGSVISMQSVTPSVQASQAAMSDARRMSSTPVRVGPQKAWGVDAEGKAVGGPSGTSESGSMQVFPPGISLARCATAAHTIVRLEVLHRSAVIAMWNGPPKWLPFCACGLVTGAYAFLLLALAVQAENTFGIYDEAKATEIEALLTNVRVLLAGLEAYGVMWAGIETMANEVRAALEAASRLPYEVRAQIENASVSPTSQQ